MVLAILNDPTLTDPLAAIVYKRLSDARRLMNKSNERLLLAQHTFEFIKAETKGGDTDRPNSAENAPIFSKIQGPVAGMRQAATLLGGKLESNKDGFTITFGGSSADLHINRGSNKSLENQRD